MSYGTDAPEGFVENIDLLSNTCNSKLRTYEIESGYNASIFTGDPVKRVGGYIVRGTPGQGAANAVCGVFKGVYYKSAGNAATFFPYWPANTVTATIPGGGNETAQAFVLDDPFIEFTIQAKGGANNNSAVRADVGRNANFAYNATPALDGVTSSGKSTAYLNMATIATTADLNCKIVSITPGFTADIGIPYQNALAQPFNNVNVLFNNHQFKGGTGTTGT